VFVPAAFTIMDDFGRMLSRKLSRFIGPKGAMELDGNEPARSCDRGHRIHL